MLNSLYIYIYLSVFTSNKYYIWSSHEENTIFHKTENNVDELDHKRNYNTIVKCKAW